MNIEQPKIKTTYKRPFRNPSNVVRLREMYDTGCFTMEELGKIWGVGTSAICQQLKK